MLTAYNGQAITYDAIGNPTSYLGWSFDWTGRSLTGATKDSQTLSFTYNSNGIRTSKTVNGVKTEYLLNGTQILAQKTGSNTLCFFYDQQGNRVGMADSSNHFYYYLYNLQGDVIALADASTGKLAATYTYDAWGKIVKINCIDPDSVAESSIAKINPFRYRGYYYDTETGLYYLNSRYYDPEVGRFINADGIINNTGTITQNLFAYCGNNPVTHKDASGYAWETIWDAISLASSIVEVAANPYDPWAWIGLAGDVADVLIPFVGGIGETTRALKAASKATGFIDTASDVKKGWKVGDDITNLTKAGNVPKWSTLRSRYWKNKAHYFPSEYTKDNVSRMRKGLAPKFDDGAGLYSMELHHILGREGNNLYLFFEITPEGHAIVDPFRFLK